MDSQHTVTQVYILGDESNIQKCVKQITGSTCDLQIVWTEIPAASLLEDGLYMECLKEVQMNNDKDLNNDTHVQAFDIDTQTYSSVGLKSNDNPSFSTTDVQQKERAMKVDINAIVIEEETRINDDLASFIFTLFTWPALNLLAIDSTTFNIAKVYLLDLNTETSSNDTNIDREYQELRKSFENELKHLEKGPSNEKNLDCHFFKVRENQEIKSVIEEEGNEWENVFEENIGLVTRDVSPWFSTHIQKVERKIKNKTISSAFLAEVSNLFGKNTTLFFVGEGIPEPLLAQIEKNHKGEAKEATFEMLLEWKNQKGQAATIADLRTAIQKSSHVIVNLHEFDQIVLRLN